MAWVRIITQDVLDRLNNNELTSYDNAGDSAPTDDKILGITKTVANRFRGAIQSCRNNTSFGPAETVPEECVFHAVSLIRHALVASLPATSELQGDERQREYDNAERYLERVAKCEEVISPHSGATGDTTAAAIIYGSATQLSFTQ